MRETPARRPDPAFRDVVLITEDGVELAGWYRPSSNGAAVVLVPSASGTRRTVLSHAQMLSRHGYGVLVYDSRGSGASTGVRNAYGWTWTADVRAAVGYVAAQPDVTPGRVAALGLSTGADVLIEAAADPSTGLAAVVADGATARSEADLGSMGWLESLPLRTTFADIRILTGSAPGPSLALLASQMRGTPSLFIAAGSIPPEISLNQQYARAAHAQLWALRRVAHTRALAEHPDEYELRVVGFLDHALIESDHQAPTSAQQARVTVMSTT
jgi:predicted acyl esterase